VRTAQSLAVIATALLVGIAGSPVAGDVAYAGSGGSVYSILGIGDIRTTPGPRAQGMGYAGISLLSSQDINPLSPATWSAIDRTHLEASALYEGYNSSDVNASRYLARLDYYGAVLAIPIAPATASSWSAASCPSAMSITIRTRKDRTKAAPIRWSIRCTTPGLGGLRARWPDFRGTRWPGRRWEHHSIISSAP